MIDAFRLGLTIYRALQDGEPQGFALAPTPARQNWTFEPVSELLENENGLAAYLFDTQAEARRFMAGLEAAGEDVCLSVMGYSNLDCWAVLREIDNAEAWEEMSDGMNRPMVADMRSHPADNALAAQFTRTALPVTAWDATIYHGDRESHMDFIMEIDDRRRMSGQARITLGADSGHVDDHLDVSVEVNTLPGSDTLTPCLHFHMGDQLAFSIFQVGLQKVMLRPEKGVRIASGAFFPNGEHGYCVEVD